MLGLMKYRKYAILSVRIKHTGSYKSWLSYFSHSYIGLIQVITQGDQASQSYRKSTLNTGLMLKLKFQYFGHLIQRAGSLEKTLMLGKIEGRRRRGQEDEMVGQHDWLKHESLYFYILKIMLGGEFGGEWIHTYVWLSPFAVHLKLWQHC